jgi:hypothetical protein
MIKKGTMFLAAVLALSIGSVSFAEEAAPAKPAEVKKEEKKEEKVIAKESKVAKKEMKKEEKKDAKKEEASVKK